MRYQFGLILGLIWLVWGVSDGYGQEFPPPPMPSQQCWTRVVTGIDGRPRICTVCMTPSGPVEFCT